ncbi:hypothetical protein PT974_10458 [Cladobotryum mycophilum]|uniref:NAD dependent epimerase/dehydratase n=1 Tax=Cladobotryum mycophilum TaxID=491253 RepID=A0ABR0S9X2_9HYPO
MAPSRHSNLPDRVVPMRVVVGGVHRTGSMSFRVALWQLGFYDCYHMSTLRDNLDHEPQKWFPAFRAKYQGGTPLTRQDWDKILGHHQACVDLPAALFTAEIAEAYPEAKVVILNRDPEKWYDSVMGSIYKAIHVASPVDFLTRLYIYAFDSSTRNWVQFYRTMTGVGMPYDHGKEKDKAIAWFNRQYQEFRDRIPEERRLEFKVQDGWGPLCEFLEVPVPMVKDETTGEMVEAPFPRVNDREGFMNEFNTHQAECLERANGHVFRGLGKLAVTLAIGYGGYLAWTTRLGRRL